MIPTVTAPLAPLLGPGLRVAIAGTVRAGRNVPAHFYAGPGNHFWYLLRESGLVPRLLEPDEDEALPGFGVGLLDLVSDVTEVAGREPEVSWRLAAFETALREADPPAVAFVSKTAAARYARAVGLRAPAGYGATVWSVAGRPGFVLPGPSGANNGMPLPLRTALWRDLVDFLATL